MNIPIVTAKHHVNDVNQDVRWHLYHSPSTCSRVILTALEEIGAPYAETGLTFSRGEHKQPDYLAINPKGKVPGLLDNGKLVSESAAILYHLAINHADANLLPIGENGRPTLDALSDIIWMTSALHPAMNKVALPHFTSERDAAGIKSLGTDQLNFYAMMISKRYEVAENYYGDTWSIADFYVGWIFGLAATFGFPIENYPYLVALKARADARPAFLRARNIEIETAARQQMQFPPGVEL